MPLIPCSRLRLRCIIFILLAHITACQKFAWPDETLAQKSAVVDNVAPANVSVFVATAGNTQVSFTWVNPADTDLAGVRIVRKLGGFPVDMNDGTVVSSALVTTFTDTGLTNGTQYYYGAYAFDASGNFATGVQDSATPLGTIVNIPVLAPAGALYNSPQNVAMSSTSTPDVICYTTDGVTNPACTTSTCTLGTTFSAAVNVAATQTLKAMACKTGFTPSGIVTEIYTIDTIPPADATSFVATPGNAQVSLSWANPGDADFAGVKIIRKVGSAPTNNTDGTQIFNAIGTNFVDSGLTNATQYFYALYAFDTAVNYAAGVQISATPVAGIVNDPTFTPIPGTYGPGLNVTITLTPVPDNVCYTTNGTNPSCLLGGCLSGASYSGPVPVASTQTLKAIGCKNLFADSNVVTGAYTIDTTPTAAVSGFAGTPSNTQVVLAWTNPGDVDYLSTKILRKTGSAPLNDTDGIAVYNSTGTSFNDTGLVNGTKYFYAAFAYDAVNNVSTAAQITAIPSMPGWYTFLGSGGNERIDAIAATNDGGVIIAASATVNFATLGGQPLILAHAGGAFDFLVVKLTNTGSVQWYTFLGGTASDKAFGVTQTNDGGYVVVGTFGNPNPANLNGVMPNAGLGPVGGFDIVAVKLSTAGIVQWYSHLGSTGNDDGLTVAATTDGGVIVGGTVGASNNNLGGIGAPRNAYTASTDMFAAKLSSAGGLQWYTFLGGSGGDQGYAVSPTSDGGYVVGGYTGAAIGTLQGVPANGTYGYQGADDWLVVKLNSTGDVQWFNMMGNSSANDNVKSITQLSDGNLLVAGYGRAVATLNGMVPLEANAGGADFWMVKMTNAGNVLWHRFAGSTLDDIAYGVSFMTDGGFVIGGEVAGPVTITGPLPFLAYSGTPNDVLVAKFDTAGVPDWYTHAGGSGSDSGYAIAATTDLGAFVAGQSTVGFATLGTFNNLIPHAGSSDALVIKVRPGGTLD